MAAACWIVKQEPSDYSWEDLVRDGRTAWTGVRNFQARNNLRSMRHGDPVLFYHSGTEKRLVGLARVVREAYPDPTASAGDWVCVDLEPVRPLPSPIDLASLKADPLLSDLALVRQSRLSVSPVRPEAFSRLVGSSYRTRIRER